MGQYAKHCDYTKYTESGKIAQPLRTHATLVEDPGFIPIIYLTAHSYTTAVPGDPSSHTRHVYETQTKHSHTQNKK